MIRRAEIEPGAWFAVPCIAPATGGAIRATLAFLRVTSTDGFRVRYVEYRNGRSEDRECSPETFQAVVTREGTACGVHELPGEAVRLAGIAPPSATHSLARSLASAPE